MEPPAHGPRLRFGLTLVRDREAVPLRLAPTDNFGERWDTDVGDRRHSARGSKSKGRNSELHCDSIPTTLVAGAPQETVRVQQGFFGTAYRGAHGGWSQWLAHGHVLDVKAIDPGASCRSLASPAHGIDLVAGGPPCQPFSRAGRAKIRSLINEGRADEIDLRKELWRAFIDVVLALKPRAVLMENVPDMAIGDDLVVIRKIADLLEEAGYVV
ncbi:hypothetical protein FQR65_LT20148 [Abscondita terminalis]|nr:hypothetical protein FQR65_LT20148 [Abscondita terminalis]